MSEAISDAVQGAELAILPGDGIDELTLASHDMNDIGNAERFRGRHGNSVTYVRDVGWHIYDGVQWSLTGAEAHVRRLAHHTVKLILAEVEALQKKNGDLDGRAALLMKWSKASGQTPRVKGMIEEARAHLEIEPSCMDSDDLTLNLKNCTLSLDLDPDGSAVVNERPHAARDRLSKVMGASYNPNADCPMFMRFLNRVQPDPEVRAFLQTWMGYCLTGKTNEQKLVFNYGEGGNGKSVFVDLMAKILGGYSVSIPFGSLVRNDNKRGDSATPDLARLLGARFVRASEPERSARLAEATIKSITGGEEISVRHLHKGFFDFEPNFKLMVSGNHKPIIRGQDEGIWRRLLLVPWNENIPPSEQDKDLPDKLLKERDGVFNWMLDGLRVWLERGLVIPRAVSDATGAYRTDSDPLGSFIRTCLIEDTESSVTARDMYTAFTAWCEANGERSWSETAFGRAMPERGLEKSMGKVRKYLGVKLGDVPWPDPKNEGYDMR